MPRKEVVFFLFCLIGAAMTVAVCVIKIRDGRIEMENTGHSYHLPVGVTSSEILASARNLRGRKDAPVAVVEFADYQCPPCKLVHTELKRLLSNSPCDWHLVFRHFPLVNIHPYAFDAAVAAEAAAEQGKFWEMHDILYEHANQMLSSDILSYARSLHLDIEQFKLATNHSARVRVQRDMEEGNRIQLEGTPTLFLCERNGTISQTSLSDLRRRSR